MAILKSFEVIQRFKQFLWTRRAYLQFSENVRQYHGVDLHVYFRCYRDLFNQYYRGRRATFEEFWSDLVNLGFEYPATPEGQEYWSSIFREWRQHLHELLSSTK